MIDLRLANERIVQDLLIGPLLVSLVDASADRSVGLLIIRGAVHPKSVTGEDMPILLLIIAGLACSCDFCALYCIDSIHIVDT